MKNAMIFGDSHVGALKKGLDALVERDGWASDWSLRVVPLCRGGRMPTPFFQAGAHSISFSGFSERIPAQQDTAIYGFSGNAHTTRVLRNINWSTHAPAAIARDEAPLSRAMLREMFWYDQRYMLLLLDSMKRLGLPVFVVEAPHLFRHNTVFTKARSEVLLHVDRAYRAFFKDELAKRDVQLVTVPSSCLDEDGFMLDIYRNPNPRDNHHANGAFGEIMLGEIVTHLERSA